MQKMLPSTPSQVLRLLIKQTHLCLPLDQVQKILPLMMLEAIPHSPPDIVGLLNFAGKSIPVIDLGVRLGYERDQPYSLDAPLILCVNDQDNLALIVDQVLGLADLAAESLQMQKQFQSSPFLGSVAIDKQLSFILNVKRLFKLTPELNKQTVKRKKTAQGETL